MKIRTVAVVGATELGCRIASLSLRGGFPTLLEDVSITALERGTATIHEMLGSHGARMGREEVLARLATMQSVEEAAREADLLIEAVADEFEMKLELFTIFDKFAKPGAILASTTKLFSITDLAEMTFCPERCIGMRFAADAGGLARVELVKGRLTSEETVAQCREFAGRLNLRV